MWLCDIAAMVEACADQLDWDRCLGERRRANWLACAVGLAERLLGARIKGTPMEANVRRVPEWLFTTVLQRWKKERTTYGPAMVNTLSHPREMLRALQRRWPPDPLEATVVIGGEFNRFPRLWYQVAYSTVRAGKFLRKMKPRVE